MLESEKEATYKSIANMRRQLDALEEKVKSCPIGKSVVHSVYIEFDIENYEVKLIKAITTID